MTRLYPVTNGTAPNTLWQDISGWALSVPIAFVLAVVLFFEAGRRGA